MVSRFVHRLRRRSIPLVFVVALLAAMMPTAAFAHAVGNVHWSRPPAQQQQVRKPVVQHPPAHTYCSVTYKVRKGDTLSKIARHYRTTVRYLAQINRIPNPNRIYAGEVLCIR